MIDTWSGLQDQGRGAFVFKEKLKIMKISLKKWNTEAFGDMNVTRSGLVRRLGELDTLAESGSLNPMQAKERHEVHTEFWRASKLNESILRQKSRDK